jgi:hypothetical protein
VARKGWGGQIRTYQSKGQAVLGGVELAGGDPGEGAAQGRVGEGDPVTGFLQDPDGGLARHETAVVLLLGRASGAVGDKAGHHQLPAGGHQPQEAVADRVEHRPQPAR